MSDYEYATPAKNPALDLDKDLVKLFDKEDSLRMDRDALAEEINLIEWRRSIRKGGAA